MRSTWKGHIQMALISIPVKLGGAVGKNDLDLHMYRKSDGSRIQFKKVAATDGTEVSMGEIVKGYETGDGSAVLFDDAELDEAYGEANHVASVVMFTSPDRVSRIAAANSYLVQPDKGGEKTYALLAASLSHTNKVAILRLAVGQRDALAVLYPTESGHLVIEKLNWSADIRKPDFAAPENTASEIEQKQAEMLIEAMSGDFDHSTYSDESQQRLAELVKAKIEAGNTVGVKSRPEVQDGGSVFPDLMSAINASIAAQKPAAAPRKARTKKVAA